LPHQYLLYDNRENYPGEAKIGFEMEALTAVSIASLTIYDFCKSIDNNIKIIEISLDYKKNPKKINR